MSIVTRLDVEGMRRELGGTVFAAGITHLDDVDSTNRWLRAAAAAGAPSGSVVLAECQTAGRGRRGRQWTAPAGSSILLSVLLRAPTACQMTDFTMLGALSVAAAIERSCGLTTEIKWPNDVLVDGKKVCGILAESLAIAPESSVVLGIGLNCNFDPREVADIPPTATSLQTAAGHIVDRTTVAIALLICLDLWYRCLLDEPDAVFAAWKTRLNCFGRKVLVHDASTVWSGDAVAVLRDGGLQIKDEGGTVRTVYAADVSLRPLTDDSDLSSRLTT